jgi:hypothetical protein
MVDISSLITILTTDRNAMNSRRIVYIASFQINGYMKRLDGGHLHPKLEVPLD